MVAFVASGSIGNEIFFDKNGNGLLDAGEGFAGVTVYLDENSDGTIDATAVTDLNGLYLFEGLDAGNYTVTVDTTTLPGGIAYTNTVDPDGVNDSISFVALAAGENNLAQDFGYRAFDFGDAPDSYGTTGAAGGARHVLSVGQTAATPALYLGDTVDSETNGAPSVGANGDDLAGGDDEDGVQFLTALQAGQTAQISVTVREEVGVDGRLSAWIDFNRDGDFADAGEKILSDVAVADGVQTLNFTVAAGAVAGDTYARFRLSSDLGLGATGQASNGEVEDYKVALTAAPVGSIGNEVFFDKNGNGVRDAGEGFANVSVLLDQNADGTFEASTFTDVNGLYQFNNLPAGTYRVLVDASTLPGFGNYTNTVDPDGGTDSTSLVNLGVGENNTAQDFGYRGFDFGDAPDTYGTTGAANGARHVVSVGQTAATPALFLGAKVDIETNGQPTVGADGDDAIFAGDDEDGIQFLTSLTAGQTAQLGVTVREAAGVDGRLSAWIDFNRDGDFADAGEKILSDVAVADGVQTLNFTVAAGAVAGDTYARFRLSSDLGLGATGQASNGEVEDYKVALKAAPVGSIGDEVFFDKNGNGVRDAGEGFAGVTVRLDKDNNGTIDATAITDANGLYKFDGLGAGSYKVTVDTSTLPGGVSYANTVDPDGGANSSSIVSLLAGQNNLAQDFGYRAFDFGDAPDSYGTTSAANGARHVLSVGQTAATPALYLGAKVDAEANGAPSVGAVGDDLAGGDDEDGVLFLSKIEAGETAQIKVTVREAAGVNGKLSGWIDFNRDGDFSDAGEKILSDVAVVDGVQTLSFTAAGTAIAGDTYARFRLSTDAGLGATGQASNGEVEDYKVKIAQPCIPVTFDFSGNSSTDGYDGNSRSWTDYSTGLKVTARAFSQDKGTDNWQSAYLGSYGGGLGVTDSSEGSGANNAHTVDNVGRNNYVVFQFSKEVTLDKAYLGYVVNDSDMQVWIGNSSSAITSMSKAKLASLGYSELNSTTLTTARWADLNAGEMSGNTIIIAADTTDTSPEDYFKIQKLAVCSGELISDKPVDGCFI
ncbi:MAG: carboxypeptidase regulatory-like domain-containing protein [Alphaproteobacteria bacterium]|nr:carboxypeptidase regulatory-like domain-containing protein [Alphaproteobacteria bacterium]